MMAKTDNEDRLEPLIRVNAPSDDWVRKDETGYYFEIAFDDKRFKFYIIGGGVIENDRE